MEALSIIDYIDGLTAFVLDKAVLKRIAFDRGVLDIDPKDLTEKQKELLHADVLFVIWKWNFGLTQMVILTLQNKKRIKLQLSHQVNQS